MKKGSIELARRLCAEINGKLHPDDAEGNQYGSVEIAEILSAECEKLKAENIALEAQIAGGVRVEAWNTCAGFIKAASPGLGNSYNECNATLLLDEQGEKSK